MPKNLKEVELHLPLETLVDTLCKLPQEDLIEVNRRLEERLQHTGPAVHRQDVFRETHDSLEDAEFWDTGPGREILAEADPPVTLEDALKITSKIKGSLAAHIIAQREER